MNKQEEIQELKSILSSIISLDKQYREHNYNYRYAPKAKDREYAGKNMSIYSDYIEQELCNPIVSKIIKRDSPFQFENFWREAGSVVPGYIEKIESRLNDLIADAHTSD